MSHLCPSGCGSASSPAIYTSSASHTDTPSPPTTVSPPVSPAGKTWIQRVVVVGSLLFYARALDLSILTAVCQLFSYQSNPTQLDLTAAHRLLNYVSSHPNPYKTTHPSSMALWACTDASYTCLDLSRAVSLVGRSDLETHPTTSSTHPQKFVDKVSERNSPLSVPPASSNHTLLTHPLPPLPTMHPPLHAF
jgi:hypothetical protein